MISDLEEVLWTWSGAEIQRTFCGLDFWDQEPEKVVAMIGEKEKPFLMTRRLEGEW